MAKIKKIITSYLGQPQNNSTEKTIRMYAKDAKRFCAEYPSLTKLNKDLPMPWDLIFQTPVGGYNKDQNQ